MPNRGICGSARPRLEGYESRRTHLIICLREEAVCLQLAEQPILPGDATDGAVGCCQGDEERSDADGDVRQEDDADVQDVGGPLLILWKTLGK